VSGHFQTNSIVLCTMTIITKPIQEKKENEEKIKIEADFTAVGTVSVDESQSAVIRDTYLAWRRRRLLTTICAAFLFIWLLLSAIIGGVMLYRYMHRRPVYYGWCGTSYRNQADQSDEIDNGLQALPPRYNQMQERVEVDAENGVAKIEVPRFGMNRPSVFIHDFKQNITAIVDVMGDNCFIKDLDRSHVAPPENFIDLMRKMESGYYEENADVIREEYKVKLPALTEDELSNLGSWMIAQQCRDKSTFMLEKSSTGLRKKRANCKCSKFMYFNPKDAVVSMDLCPC